MQTELIYFTLYIIAIVWAMPKAGFVKKTGLHPHRIRLLLMAKILIALIATYYFTLLPNSDALANNVEGKLQYELLKSNPTLFFDEFKRDIGLYGFGNLFDTSNSFWGYLRFHLVYKAVAIFSFITRGNFYFNSVIFSSLVFFANIAFYRIYNGIYPGKQLLKIVVCFFIPSMALFTACAHKDGFVFLSLGISSYIFYSWLQPRASINLKKIVAFIGALICLFLFRNYVLVALLPAMFIALLANRLNKHKAAAVAGFYLLAMIAFFATGLLNNSFNLPKAVIKRKADFALLEKGSSDLPMRELHPHFLSFASNAPEAVNHVVLRPYPGEFGTISALLSSIELYIYLALLLLFLWKFKRGFTARIHPFNIYGLAFFISMVLIIGFTIPNAGAISRYRSIIWIFLLAPVVCNLFLYKKAK